MVAWLEPLELQTIFISIFAGNPDIFTAIALIILSGMAAYFRMTITTLFFMLGIFILMFSGSINSPLVAMFSIFGGLFIGYMVSKFTQL